MASASVVLSRYRLLSLVQVFPDPLGRSSWIKSFQPSTPVLNKIFKAVKIWRRSSDPPCHSCYAWTSLAVNYPIRVFSAYYCNYLESFQAHPWQIPRLGLVQARKRSGRCPIHRQSPFLWSPSAVIRVDHNSDTISHISISKLVLSRIFMQFSIHLRYHFIFTDYIRQSSSSLWTSRRSLMSFWASIQ